MEKYIDHDHCDRFIDTVIIFVMLIKNIIYK